MWIDVNQVVYETEKASRNGKIEIINTVENKSIRKYSFINRGTILSKE